MRCALQNVHQVPAGIHQPDQVARRHPVRKMHAAQQDEFVLDAVGAHQEAVPGRATRCGADEYRVDQKVVRRRSALRAVHLHTDEADAVTAPLDERHSGQGQATAVHQRPSRLQVQPQTGGLQRGGHRARTERGRQQFTQPVTADGLLVERVHRAQLSVLPGDLFIAPGRARAMGGPEGPPLFAIIEVADRNAAADVDELRTMPLLAQPADQPDRLSQHRGPVCCAVAVQVEVHPGHSQAEAGREYLGPGSGRRPEPRGRQSLAGFGGQPWGNLSDGSEFGRQRGHGGRLGGRVERDGHPGRHRQPKQPLGFDRRGQNDPPTRDAALQRLLQLGFAGHVDAVPEPDDLVDQAEGLVRLAGEEQADLDPRTPARLHKLLRVAPHGGRVDQVDG